MLIIIKPHNNKLPAKILKAPSNKSAGTTVELWQKRSAYYQQHGKLLPVTWKVAESDNIRDAVIEAATIGY